MRPKRISLTQHLIEENRKYGTVPEELRLLLEVVCRACKTISHSVGKGALGNILGSNETENVPEKTGCALQRNPSGIQ